MRAVAQNHESVCNGRHFKQLIEPVHPHLLRGRERIGMPGIGQYNPMFTGYLIGPALNRGANIELARDEQGIGIVGRNLLLPRPTRGKETVQAAKEQRRGALEYGPLTLTIGAGNGLGIPIDHIAFY
mgnify:FL=1